MSQENFESLIIHHVPIIFPYFPIFSIIFPYFPIFSIIFPVIRPGAETIWRPCGARGDMWRKSWRLRLGAVAPKYSLGQFGNRKVGNVQHIRFNHIHIYIYIYIYVHVYIYIHMYMYVYVYVYVCMYVHVYIYIHVHAHAYSHRHRHIHPCIHTCARCMELAHVWVIPCPEMPLAGTQRFVYQRVSTKWDIRHVGLRTRKGFVICRF